MEGRRTRVCARELSTQTVSNTNVYSDSLHTREELDFALCCFNDVLITNAAQR